MWMKFKGSREKKSSAIHLQNKHIGYANGRGTTPPGAQLAIPCERKDAVFFLFSSDSCFIVGSRFYFQFFWLQILPYQLHFQKK